MIARTWHGRIRPSDADAYVAYVNATGIRAFRATPGNRGSMIWLRTEDDVTHIQVVSFWDSMEAIRRFAGETPEVPVYYPEDERFLLEKEARVEHYDVPWRDG
jgi:heme-degrading monooxygenase HmoA